MTKYEFPTGEYGQAEILVPIDRSLIPLISGRLDTLLQEGVWRSYTDYENGYNAIAKVMAAMAGGTLAELIEVQRATYRLLDAALNGTVYQEEVGGVMPAVPAVPAAPDASVAAMRSNVLRLVQLGENAATGAAYASAANGEGVALDAAGGWTARLNAVQGVKDATWFGGGVPVTLADLQAKQAIVSETDEGLVDDGIQEVLSTLQDTSGVGNTLRTIFSAAVDTASDGGVMLAIITSAIASAAGTASTLAGLTAVVAELRAINRRLTGSDENGDPALVSEVPTIRQSIRDIRTFTSQTAARLIDENGELSAADALVSVANDAALTSGRLLTANGQRGELLDLVSQVRPLAGGNDLYSALVAISDNTRRSAECCEDGLPPADPAPEPMPGDCSTGVEPDGGFVDFPGLDFSASAALGGVGMTTNVAQLTIVSAPGALEGVAIRNSSIVTIYHNAIWTQADSDNGEYRLSITNVDGDGEFSNTPQNAYTQLLMPANNCVVSTFIDNDISGNDIYYYVSIGRLENGELTTWNGPQPKLKFFTGDFVG